MTIRNDYKSKSNNLINPNKNICALAVADVLGVSDNVRYLHTMNDILKALRTKYTARSRFSKLNKTKTISRSRKKIKSLADNKTIGFVIGVKGHVLFVNNLADVIIDTDPRLRDRREITELYIIERKP